MTSKSVIKETSLDTQEFSSVKFPKIFLTVCHHQIVSYYRYKINRFDFEHKMGTKFAIPGIPLNTQGLFFRKFAYSRYDVSSEIFSTEHIKAL
jgi:hypothetical protein